MSKDWLSVDNFPAIDTGGDGFLSPPNFCITSLLNAPVIYEPWRRPRAIYLRGSGATLHRMIDIIAVPDARRGGQYLTEDVHNIHRWLET